MTIPDAPIEALIGHATDDDAQTGPAADVRVTLTDGVQVVKS